MGFSTSYYKTIFLSLMSLRKSSSISIETRFDNTSDLQHKAGRLSWAGVSYQSRSCWRSAWRREGRCASRMNTFVELHEEGSWSDSAEGNDIWLKFLLYSRFWCITNFWDFLKPESKMSISKPIFRTCSGFGILCLIFIRAQPALTSKFWYALE